MKCVLTIQEKLKDLRVARHLTLAELSTATGLSRLALGSYGCIENKDISHSAIKKLAEFYSVSTDYLLGLIENVDHKNCEITDLHLDDETVNLLIEGRLNIRLLCEIIKHKDFEKFLNDMEIYIDSLATMQINNLNAYVSMVRTQLQTKHNLPDNEYYVQTLKTAEIDENDYFTRLISNDITGIAKGLKEAHKRDTETGENNSLISETINLIKEYDSTDGPLKTTLTILGKQLAMNFSKLDTYEMKTFTTIIEKYSDVYKNVYTSGGK